MNVYELIDDLYHAHSYLTAGSDGEWPYIPVRKMLDAYLSLEPNWHDAPDWAQFYVVVPGGRAIWSETELEILPEGDGWRDKDEIGLWSLAGLVDLPIGIDWRVCNWTRQQPLSTHNNSLSDQEPTP